MWASLPHPRLSYTVFSLFPVHSVPTSSSHAPQMGWQVTACYSLYLAPFNGCRCTHCCTAFPRSPQLLIIPLKWFHTCHHFHIKMICFNCTHRDVQIICCEQLIGFRSVCLQITACLFEGFTEVLNHWRYFRYFGPEGHQHCGLERADVTYSGWNAKGHFVGSTSGWWQCLIFRRLSELLSSIIHVCTEPSWAAVPQEQPQC